MKKALSLITLLVVVPLSTYAASNLWELYHGHIPSIPSRAISYQAAGFNDVYTGTGTQNERLLNVLQNPKLGSLAFPPSTVEGTSTAGWTDDGSIVRLNTQSDFVGIGTLNPGEKLSVVGNEYLTGTFSFSGGTLNFGSSNGSGTSTLSSLNGNLGIASSTPSQKLTVGGNVSVANLTIASTTLTGNGVTYTLPSAQGAASQVLTNDGTGILSWAAPTSQTGWQQLGENVLSTSTATVINVNNFATRQDLWIVLSVPAGGDAGITLRFNGDVSAHYSSRRIKNDGETKSTTLGDTAVNSTFGTTSEMLGNIFIVNATTSQVISGNYEINTAILSGVIPGIPGKDESFFAWYSNNAQISTVSFIATTFPIGSRVTVYGKQN
jgi:hypothetical protein